MRLVLAHAMQGIVGAGIVAVNESFTMLVFPQQEQTVTDAPDAPGRLEQRLTENLQGSAKPLASVLKLTMVAQSSQFQDYFYACFFQKPP